MRSSIIEKAFRECVEKRLGEDGAYPVYLDYLRKLKAGFFDGWYADALLQTSERHAPLTIYDAFGFAQLHIEILSGNVVHAQVALGEEPSADKLMDENNKKLAKLSQMHNGMFSATFMGGDCGSDGFFEITKEIDFVRTTVDREDKQVTEIIKTPTMALELEVGTVSAGRMFHYFTGTSGVARWPYYSKTIFLFHNLLGPRHVLELDKLLRTPK